MVVHRSTRAVASTVSRLRYAAHYWKLQFNEGDEIYINSLFQGNNLNSYWTFYDAFLTERDQESHTGGSSDIQGEVHCSHDWNAVPSPF
jgi:hypothetical protein